jgi:hypothetical protein
MSENENPRFAIKSGSVIMSTRYDTYDEAERWALENGPLGSSYEIVPVNAPGGFTKYEAQDICDFETAANTMLATDAERTAYLQALVDAASLVERHTESPSQLLIELRDRLRSRVKKERP